MSRESYKVYLASPEWQTRRVAALERAQHRCQLCNSSQRLNVHHRTYERVGNEDPCDLTVLCQKCHEKFHGIDGSKPRRVNTTKPAKPTGQEAMERLRAVLPNLKPGVSYSTKHLGNLAGLNSARAGVGAVALAKRGELVKQARKKWLLPGASIARPDALGVSCPSCGVEIGQTCPMGGVHLSRQRAAEGMAMA